VRSIIQINYTFNRLLFSLCILALVVSSCSTKKNKWPNRAYHNTTSHYNSWFNGNEVIKEIELNLSTAHVDNFYKVIPVYRLGTLEDSKAILANADKSIKKGSMVIAKHNMYIRGKQYNRYIDDAYMLVGKGNYYKREYYTALEMFTFVTREAVKNNRKDPIQHLANIWQARAYTEIGMLSDAQMAFDRSLNDKALPKSVKGELFAALTDFHLRQNNYSKALEYVTEAIKYTKSKKFKTRLIFIQGQLFQKTDKLKEASEAYDKVLKMNPSYEMSFYSRINKARSYNSESGNSLAIRALLAAMMKDPKNFDLIDQIYYVLGEIEEKEDKEEVAIEQYNKSLRASTTNQAQKGLSYLAIAEIYFEDKSYRLAASYYDSCIATLPKDYPDYKKAESIQSSLAELVKRYNTIERYDSLLRMSNLTKEQLDKKLEEIIAKEEDDLKKQRAKEAEQRAKDEADQANGGPNTPGGAQTGPGVSGNGQWYFYNPSAMGFGFSEFRKIWGERKLEDHWRRSNKQSIQPVVNNDPDPTGDPDKAGDPKEKGKPLSREDSVALAKKRLIKDLPTDEKQKTAFADSVLEAFYALGMIYRERLNDLKESAKTFEEFLRKYPGDVSEATVYYQLYRIFLKMPDNSNAEKYRNLLLSKFPDSEYSLIIKDPNFFAASNMSKKETETFYEETYRLYKAREYKTVLDRCRNAEIRFTGNPLLAKFSLLKALAIGQMKDVAAFRGALQEVVKAFPGDTVEIRAKDMLKSLDKAQGIAPRDSAEIRKPQFVYKPDTTQFFVVVIEDRSMNLNDFKVKLSDFNNQYFSLKNLQVASRLLGTNYQVITVQQFANKKESMDFMMAVDSDDELFADMNMDITDVFIISAGNYQLLMKEGNVSEYVDFYKKVYE
jgi:tetratricopeptide (TPR) repeat protein